MADKDIILRGPIRWFGGKGRLVGKLLERIPKHDFYLEVFGGGGSLLFAKKPAKIDVYNDIDSSLYNFYMVLSDEQKFESFYRIVDALPYSRELFVKCKYELSKSEDEVKRAVAFFVLSRQSFGGIYGSGWGYDKTATSGQVPRSLRTWMTCVDKLPEIHERLRAVQVENLDFRKVLLKYNDERYFVYVDPPYVSDTRKSGQYDYEMDDNDHEELLDILLSHKGMVMVSGYQNKIYERLTENGWYKEDFDVKRHTGLRVMTENEEVNQKMRDSIKRVESIWVNPKLSTETSCDGGFL